MLCRFYRYTRVSTIVLSVLISLSVEACQDGYLHPVSLHLAIDSQWMPQQIRVIPTTMQPNSEFEVQDKSAYKDFSGGTINLGLLCLSAAFVWTNNFSVLRVLKLKPTCHARGSYTYLISRSKCQYGVFDSLSLTLRPCRYLFFIIYAQLQTLSHYWTPSAPRDVCTNKLHHLVLLTDPRFSYKVLPTRKKTNVSCDLSGRIGNIGYRICKLSWWVHTNVHGIAYSYDVCVVLCCFGISILLLASYRYWISGFLRKDTI